MTQASTVRPTIPLRLVSMRLPETMDWIRKKAEVSERPNVLTLTPGLAGEIVLELENEGSQPIDWTMEMMGDFPSSWYLQELGVGELGSWGVGELGLSQPTPLYQVSDRIAPGDRLSPAIRLQIPADFFEAQAALAEHSTLRLDYRGEIYVFARWQGERRLVGYQSLQIEVRPDTSYMTLLPEIFQSEDFMMRFLSIFEQTFDPSLQMMRSLWAYLDPLTAPRSMLPFLSKWVAWDMEPRWSLKQQRRLMRYAIELYRWRGTRRGIRYYLHLYTNLRLDEDKPEDQKQISITDETKDAFVFGEAEFGEQMMMGGGKPFHFYVTLRPDSLEEYDQLDEPMIRRVLEQVKPAFCTYDLAIVSPSDNDDGLEGETLPPTVPMTTGIL